MNKKIIFSLFALQLFVTIQPAKMRLYALYTPSHKILVEKYFLPSIQDDFDLQIVQTEQTSSSARYMSSGWIETTIKKIELILQAIQDCWGEIFVFSDVDIQFFDPIENMVFELMKDKDMVIQKDHPSGTVCSGFFACRANEKTEALFRHVYQRMVDDKNCSDQLALNRCLKPKKSKENQFNVVWEYLPDNFFGAGTITGKRWRKNKRLPIPKNILMHHANWTKGIRNKIAQLEYVKRVVRAWRKS